MTLTPTVILGTEIITAGGDLLSFLNLCFLLVGDNNILYREYCTYTSLFNIMTMLCSLTSVTAVALNRFLVICCSKSTYEKFTRRRTVALSILLIWLYCFCLVSPPLAGYGTFAYHSKFRTCFFLANDEESRMYGVIFCCLLGVFPPVVASVFFYAKILLKLAQNKQNLQKHFLPPISQVIADMKKSSSNPNLEPVSTNSSDELINTKQVAFTGVRKESESNGSRSSQKNSTKTRRQRSSAHSIRQNNRHRRTVLMLFVVFLNIVVCWAPISISFIADANSRMPSLVYVSFAILAWSSSCVNVFIYAGMNLTFRRAYIQVLTRPCNRGKMLTLSSGSGLESQTGTAQGGNLHLQTDNNGNTMR